MFNTLSYLDDHIHGHKFAEICDYKINTNDFIIDPAQLQENKLVFVKTDKLKDFFDIIRNLPYKYVIVSHNSDHNINEERYGWKSDNVVYWFAQNVLIDKPDLIPIPIGAENPEIGNGGNVDDFRINVTGEWIKNAHCYVNFSNGTNPVRQGIKDFFRGRGDCDIQESRIPFRHYLQEVRRSNFIISPPGGGNDCHRTWEALYSGSIPVCQLDPQNEFFSKLFPMILYQDYRDMSRNELEGRAVQIRHKLRMQEYTLQALKFGWWKDYINWHVKMAFS